MKFKRLFVMVGAAVLSLSAVSIVLPANKAQVTFATYTNGDAATYYSGISDSLTGDSLLSALRSLNSTKRQSTVGYSSMGTTPSGQFKYTDYVTSTVKYDSNGQPYGTEIVSFYSGNATKSFNREHVWPNSHGGNVIEDDIHMPRPTISTENGSRGNSFYVEGMKSTTDGWDPAMESFGDETYRGDSARIIFYCMLVDDRLSLIEAEKHSTSNSNKDYMMGKLSDLIKWNINYPVLDREQRRNEGAEYLQGNRNPFIDHPEYACRIWGDSNATTKSLCASADYPTVAHTAGIRSDDGDNISSNDVTSYTLAVDETVNFLPYVDGAYNSSVSWELSDYDVASTTYYSRDSYTNGVTITGLTEGTSTLTLSYSYDDNGTTKYATASCLITVSNGGSSGGDDVPATSGSVTIDSSTTGLTTSDEENTLTSGSFSFKAKAKIFNSEKVWLTKDSGYLYNTTNFGKIKKVTLNYASGGSDSAYQHLSFGTSQISGYTTTATNGTTFTNSSGGSSNSFTPTGDYGYFNLSVSNKNLQLSSIVIEYQGSGSSGDEDITLSYIEVSDMTQAYEVGDTFSFDGVCTAYYDGKDPAIVTPTSVSSPDMSTAGNKTVTVSYTEGGVTETVDYIIYLTEPVITLDYIVVSGQTTSYEVGDTFSFDGTCTAYYSDDSHKVVTPTSVTTPNMSTAGNKTVTVTYTEGGVTETTNYSITVTNKTVAVTGVSLNTNSLSLEEGETKTLTATISPSNATNQNVSWESSDESVATVSNSGLVTAISEGEATITVTTEDGYKYDECDVTVTASSIVPPTPTSDYSLTSGSPYINGVPYKMYFYNTNKSSNYYFTGNMNGYYGETSTDITNGVDVYFEQSGDGQKIYFLDGETKNYFYINISGNYINFKFGTPSDDTIVWKYVSNDDYTCLTYTINSNPYTFGTYSDYTTFNGVNLTKYPNSYLVDFILYDQEYATGFAQAVNACITCDSTGENAPTIKTGFSWSDFELAYSKLGDNPKDHFSGTSSDTYIADFVARYDYIVGKYAYTDFLGRNPASIVNKFNNSNISSSDDSLLIVVIASSVTMVLGATLILIKRRKRR